MALTITKDFLVSKLTRAINAMDGAELEELHNKIFPEAVTYLGDSLFEAETDYTAIREVLVAVGVSIFEDNAQSGAWSWKAKAGPCEISYPSEEEAIYAAWSHVGEKFRVQYGIYLETWDGLSLSGQIELIASAQALQL